MRNVRMILVGGFLGAGKTTLLGAAARAFMAQGKRVGIITNDQAADLVDTGLLQRAGFGVGEVAGGCFCCRFSDLVGAADRLMNELRPDILLGEPVGSCTDISATVLQPLKQLYADWFRLAPFTVLAEPARLREALSPEAEKRFPESVLYIFRKQLEEADLIAISKADLASAAELAELRALLAKAAPAARALALSSLKGEGVAEWLRAVMEDAPAGKRIAAVDYDTYAEGEAVLGWLNAAVALSAGEPRDWAGFCRDLLEGLRADLTGRGAEIAHLKLLLTTSGGSLTGNVTGNAAPAALAGEPPTPSREAHLVLNARVHLGPEALRAAVESRLEALAGEGAAAEIVAMRNFSPSRPRPTHRFTSVVKA